MPKIKSQKKENILFKIKYYNLILIIYIIREYNITEEKTLLR